MQFCRPAVYLIQQTSESDNCFGEIKTTTSYKSVTMSFQTLEVIFQVIYNILCNAAETCRVLLCWFEDNYSTNLRATIGCTNTWH